MCTIIAKKFPNIGWIGLKNRDRPAATNTELLRNEVNGIQRVSLVDELTRWSEGMNSNGVSIISSSLNQTVGGSEVHLSKDGLKIREALEQATVEKAVNSLKKHRVVGCVMVFDAEQLWLIEGQPGTHDQVAKRIADPWIARTNHGIWLPHAGYQKNSDNNILKMRRISSEARLDIARYILQTVKKPADLMPLMAKKWTDNPQVTTLRYPTSEIDTRTTEQLMLDPKNKMILIRNTDGVLEFDQNNANPSGSKVQVGIVDL
jgi:hypothetical protein